MARECGPSPHMRNRMDALHTTVCSAIIRISRRNRLIANSQMSRAQTPYTWHMGTHHSLDRLFAVARQERRCAIPSTNTDIQAIRRRVKTGAVLRVFRGLYAEPAYWELLDPHEQVRHIVRALAIQHPDWVFCGPTAAIMHGLLLSAGIPNLHRREPRRASSGHQAHIASRDHASGHHRGSGSEGHQLAANTVRPRGMPASALRPRASGLCAPQRPRERIRAPGVSLQREILTQPRRRRARVRACRSACRERRRIRGPRHVA